MEQTQSMKVAILRDQDAAVRPGQLPNIWIGSAATIQKTNVKGVRKHVDQLANQNLRQLFVEEQLHRFKPRWRLFGAPARRRRSSRRGYRLV